MSEIQSFFQRLYQYQHCPDEIPSPDPIMMSLAQMIGDTQVEDWNFDDLILELGQAPPLDKEWQVIYDLIQPLLSSQSLVHREKIVFLQSICGPDRQIWNFLKQKFQSSPVLTGTYCWMINEMWRVLLPEEEECTFSLEDPRWWKITKVQEFSQFPIILAELVNQQLNLLTQKIILNWKSIKNMKYELLSLAPYAKVIKYDANVPRATHFVFSLLNLWSFISDLLKVMKRIRTTLEEKISELRDKNIQGPLDDLFNECEEEGQNLDYWEIPFSQKNRSEEVCKKFLEKFISILIAAGNSSEKEEEEEEEEVKKEKKRKRSSQQEDDTSEQEINKEKFPVKPNIPEQEGEAIYIYDKIYILKVPDLYKEFFTSLCKAFYSHTWNNSVEKYPEYIVDESCDTKKLKAFLPYQSQGKKAAKVFPLKYQVHDTKKKGKPLKLFATIEKFIQGEHLMDQGHIVYFVPALQEPVFCYTFSKKKKFLVTILSGERMKLLRNYFWMDQLYKKIRKKETKKRKQEKMISLFRALVMNEKITLQDLETHLSKKTIQPYCQDVTEENLLWKTIRMFRRNKTIKDLLELAAKTEFEAME